MFCCTFLLQYIHIKRVLSTSKPNKLYFVIPIYPILRYILFYYHFCFLTLLTCILSFISFFFSSSFVPLVCFDTRSLGTAKRFRCPEVTLRQNHQIQHQNLIRLAMYHNNTRIKIIFNFTRLQFICHRMLFCKLFNDVTHR